MNRLTLVLTLTTLAAACTVAGAQDDTPSKKADAPREEKKERDPAVDAWAETLAANLNHENKRIRASAAKGLVALGPAALRTLGKRAGSEDEKVADTAMNLIARIKAGEAHGRRRGAKARGPRGREGMRNRGPDRRGPGARRGPGPDGMRRRGPDGMRGRGPDRMRRGGPRDDDARGPRRGPPTAPHRGDHLEGVELNDDQRKAVEGLLEQHHERMMKAFQDAGERPGREVMMKKRDESLATLKSALVEAVGEETAGKVLEAMPKPGERGPGMRGPGRRGPGSFGPPRFGPGPGGPEREGR
ncbi:MAG: hypothetical protein ACYTDX_09265 [Planctomycetota bacterium]|jgi:hypothetical protein